MFSKRNQPQPDNYFYHLPQEVRQQLMHTLKHCIEGDCEMMPQVTFTDVMYEMQGILQRKSGGMRRSGYIAAKVSDIPAIEHFFYCDDEQVMDFLEMCFETKWGCGKQRTVEAINAVLSECNVRIRAHGQCRNYESRCGCEGKFCTECSTNSYHKAKGNTTG